jgi:hypothetical protein
LENKHDFIHESPADKDTFSNLLQVITSSNVEILAFGIFGLAL